MAAPGIAGGASSRVPRSDAGCASRTTGARLQGTKCFGRLGENARRGALLAGPDAPPMITASGLT